MPLWRLEVCDGSEDFQRLLSAEGIACSMSRRGDCWDNSAIESSFASLKEERVRRAIYRTRDEGRADIFDYIEVVCHEPEA